MAFKFKRWNKTKSPDRLLVLRFHALGDIVIILPYLTSLKRSFPSISLTILTSEEFSDIPRNITLFDEVLTFNSYRSGKLQFLLCALMLPSLFIKQFDVVLDLQNNRASRFLRLLLFPSAWSEFDKSSHLSAGERTRLCIDDIGLWQTSIETSIGLRNNILAKKLLELHQLTPSQFIIINPAGAFESRNWPIENYIDFCLKWLNKFPEIKFLILGIGSIQLKAIRLREALGDSLLNLCGNTTQTEAFALIKMAKLMLTEDGGLMHMAWTQGVPTLALFGSSPSYWSAPQGSWSICLHSSDLPCGNCLLEVCKFQDNRCLTRYSAEMVFENSVRLLSSIR